MNTQTEIFDFIAALSLPDAGPPLLGASAEALPTGDGATIAGHSVVSFVSGLDQQNREDVLNSTLLMQLAATKKFDKVGQRQQWFRFYTEGLGKLGWTVASSAIEAYVPKQQSFTMDEVALEIIDSVAAGSGFAATAKKAFDALKEQPQALAVFESQNSHMGMFEILPCAQTAEGNVSMVLNCMQFETNSLRHKVLFFTYQQRAIAIYRSAQLAVLNTGVYSQAREAVLEKLGAGAKRFLAHLAI